MDPEAELEVAEVGPFRTAEPTEEARLAKERQASWARVERVTRAQIAEEQRRAERGDALAWVFFLGAVLGVGVTFGLSILQPRGPWGPLACPTTALAVASLVALVQRARWRRRHDGGRAGFLPPRGPGP